MFTIWLPRPNHYTEDIRIEILSRTPVSKSKYLSSGPQIQFLSQNVDVNLQMTTDGDGGDGDRAATLPSGQTPNP